MAQTLAYQPDKPTASKFGPGDDSTKHVYAPGSPDIDITQIMQGFGYYPTEAEAQSLAGSFTSDNNAASKAAGVSAIAQYVNQKQAEQERIKNDPLAALQTKMEESAALMKNQVQGLYGQLQDTLSSAPKLFGELTPDQIQAYLAPLKTSFDQQISTVQGVMGSRGIAASSTENNALAQTDKQFQENVLSTGLQVGLDAQKNKASSIQQQIQNLFGLTGQEEGMASNAAAQRSAQNLGQSNLIASLPYFLQQSANQQALIRKQTDSGGFWDTFNKVTSGINTAVNTTKNLFGMSPAPTAPNIPGTPGGAPGAMPAAPPSLFAPV